MTAFSVKFRPIANLRFADAKIAETTASFRSAVSGFRDSERAFNNTMAKFNETMDAMTELIKTLDNNPSSILHGKK